MRRAFVRHWPEYLMESAGTCFLVVAACTFAILLFHPSFPFPLVAENVAIRRLLMGLAMGLTSVALVYSSWGKQSGAHFNPAVTFTYYHLRRVAGSDAVWYILFQFSGALLGVALMAVIFGRWLSHPAIHYLAPMPTALGAAITWAAEFAMSTLLMTAILTASNLPRFARWTGVFAGILTVVNISLLVPLVGTSLNPARALASAVPTAAWMAMWIYVSGAPAGMLAAAVLYVRRHGPKSVFCAKLHHQNAKRCIFCETRAELAAQIESSACNQLLPAASNREMPFIGMQAGVQTQEQNACPSSAVTT